MPVETHMPFEQKRTPRTLVHLLAALAVALLPVASYAYSPGDLTSVERKVSDDHPDVRQLDPAEFGTLSTADKPVVLFDVREEAEYRVSRIPGAIRVDPGAWAFRFLGAHGAGVAGKTVVFYCSVGVRSSRLAARVQSGLKKHGAAEVYNLKGGIFRWHNERRVLENEGGATPLVHPYDAHWGALVERQGDVAREPKPAAQK